VYEVFLSFADEFCTNAYTFDKVRLKQQSVDCTTRQLWGVGQPSAPRPLQQSGTFI
jgi:hypothetical protein